MEELSREHLSKEPGRYVVVTVCTPPFLPGAMVMLRSFLDHNSWFQGDIVVLTDEVTPEMDTCLTEIYPVSFRLIGEDLLRNATEVRKAVTDRLIVEARFFAMELFGVSGYDKLLYLDSDILVRGDVSELFLRPEPILCCGDGFHYRDKLRTGSDYLPHKLRFWQRREDYWSDNFNSGVMCFDRSVITQSNYLKLAEMIHPTYFNGCEKRYHDQKLLNIHFYGEVTLMSSKYNYRLGMAKYILAKDDVRMENAAIIHFTARRKPWMSEMVDERLATELDFVRAFDWWQACWESLPKEVKKVVWETR